MVGLRRSFDKGPPGGRGPGAGVAGTNLIPQCLSSAGDYNVPWQNFAIGIDIDTTRKWR